MYTYFLIQVIHIYYICYFHLGVFKFIHIFFFSLNFSNLKINYILLLIFRARFFKITYCLQTAFTCASHLVDISSIEPVHLEHEFIFQRNSNMLLFEQNNEIGTYFFGIEKKISDIHQQFRFWDQNRFFQLFVRTFFSIVYNFVKN